MNSNEEVASPQKKINFLGLLTIAAVLVALFFAAFFLVNRLGNNSRTIKPFLPTQTPNTLQVEYAPISLEFSDLGENPSEFRNLRIQISGRFSKIAPPECRPYSGPQTTWGLVNDALQMNAIGYESIVMALSENTPMTVIGIWTFYDGSVGCGKESAEQDGIWYLKVEHILQPNPIVADPSGQPVQINAIEDENIELLPTPDATSTDENLIGATPTVLLATPSLDSSPTPTSTSASSGNVTPTATVVNSIPEETVAASATPTVTPADDDESEETQTPTATPTATAVSNATNTPPPTPTVGSPGNPPAPTATPGGGYPPPPGGGGYP